MPSLITVVRAPGAKPALQQTREMINLGARLVATPNDYISHRLYEKEKRTIDALRFLSGARAKDLQNILNRDPQALENKLEYDSNYRALGLPVPSILAVLGTSSIGTHYPQLRNKDDALKFISACVAQGNHLVIKEVAGMQGAGVLVIVDILNVEGQQFLLLSNGKTRRFEETVTELLNSPGVWLIQQRLEQHETLNQLNPTSLNTIRVGTFRNQDGTVDLDYAVLRVGRTFSQIDTFNKGGIAVRVDTKTGELAPSGFQKPKYSREEFTEHPDSKVHFKNTYIPFWDEVLELAQKFATHAGDNRMVGWDVSITPSGPVFVEGNHAWDANFAQLGAVGLLTNDFIDRLDREAGIKMSNTELPAFSPLRALRLLIKSK